MRAFRVAYDGTGYRGFQRQPHGETVEDVLLDALRSLDVLRTANDTPPGYAAAGRTDAGVSAVAQTVAFEGPEWLTPGAFNGPLPQDVWTWASADVPASFHATNDAILRTYEYHLYAPRCRVDDARIQATLSRLAGTHDYHNLTPVDTGTSRTLRATFRRDDEFLVLTFEADGFPREFVRRTASLVRAVGAGERDPDFVERILGNDVLSGPEGVSPAPPEPLVLTGVEYPDVTFVSDDVVDDARAAFTTRRVDRQTEARVAERVCSGIDE